jgi:NAD(P)-dependent dehydrogenase (short-subunit alcohol dehydrogenase family)
MGEHDGRVALVTGGSQGIGRGAALELARQGSAVAVHGLAIEAARDVVVEIERCGGRGIAVAGPVDDPATSAAAVAATLAAFGALDTLVTSAGIQRYGDIAETSPELWNEVFAVNVTGVYHAAHAAAPHLRQSPAGAIVIVASCQATATQNKVAAYTASKGALNALTRSMAVDEARHGVRVNAVCPGPVDTPMLRVFVARPDSQLPPGETPETLVVKRGGQVPSGRPAQPEEIANAALFLISDEAAYVTGVALPVDGGATA